MTVSNDVLEERVDGLAADVRQLRVDNDVDHKEFRQMALRLPPWGTALVTLLSLLLGSMLTLALKR